MQLMVSAEIYAKQTNIMEEGREGEEGRLCAEEEREQRGRDYMKEEDCGDSAFRLIR
jgi:hypothetical protein